jgi:ATP-dependent DNA helicase DinG
MVAAPIDLGPLLSKNVFEAHPTVVLTSATLSAAGDFSFLSRRLGMDRVMEGRAVTETLASPFDWERQAFIAIPTDMPAPDEEGFDDALAERTFEALMASEGGAWTLKRVHAALRPRLAAAGLPVLRQGDGERHALLASFRAEGNSVLFATDSFWEGVDVPGDALRTVILTRLPFRVPTDPVQVARAERITYEGGDPFAQLTVPQALIKFRQGLGRLIRTRTDRGILVILDKRITTRRYGRTFFKSLPPARVEQGDSTEVFRMAKEFLAAPRLAQNEPGGTSRQ